MANGLFSGIVEEQQKNRLTPSQGLFAGIVEEGMVRTAAPKKESTLQEIGEGIASGLLNIPQGLVTTATAASDAIFDTNATKAVDDFFDGIRDDFGIDPEGLPAEFVEAAVQYAVPGIGAASAVSKLSKIREAPKLIKGLAQLGAAGAVDAVVTTSDNTSLGDFFGGGPTQTADLIGLEGRERGAALLGKKFAIGVEAGAATALLDPALTLLGKTGQAGLEYAAKGPVARETARAALAAGTALSSATGAMSRNLIGDDNVEALKAVFRARGNLPSDVFEARSKIAGEVEAEAINAARTLKELKTGLDESYKKVEKIMAGDGNTKLTRAETNNELFSYLTGEIEVEVLPQALQAPAKKMRAQVDNLSNKILNSKYLNQADSEELVEQIKGNIGSYLRRKYRLFEDGGWTKTPEFADAREDVIKLFEENPQMYRSFYERVYTKGDDLPVLPPTDDFVGTGSKKKTKRASAEGLIDEFVEISANRKKYRNPMKGVTRTAVNKLKTDMFKARTVQTPAIRRLLGEIKDPEEAFISTIGDLAEFNANDQFLGYLAGRAGDTGEVLTKEAYDRLSPTRQNAFTELSEDYWGAAKGIVVSNPVYKDLTRQVRGDDESMMNIIRAGYSGLLKAKGISQYTKTVLSPVTQIRNVSSAGLFALAQGNVGSGANLFESFEIVSRGVFLRPDKDQYLDKVQRLGVIGTQTQLREIERLMKEGLGDVREADEVIGGVRVGGAAGLKFTQGSLGNFLGTAAGAAKKANNLARSFYQAGDDVWKIYNFEFERNKLLAAFDGDVAAARAAVGDIDEYAANIVKNVVPNYERVPQLVAAGRKLPIGNFVAFPAEILRTSFNTMELALKEVASSNPKIREIGLRRMTGLVGTTVAAPIAMQQLAMGLTGVSQEQIDAARRSGPPWSQNSRLIPTSTDGKGNLTGYVDYSYTNPYDYLQRPFQAIYNAVLDGKQLGQNTGQIMANASQDVLKEFFSPFVAESIITERLLDVTPAGLGGRGGVTQTGSRVYKEGDADTSGTKIAKSLFHVAEAFNPGGSPVTFKAQKKETQMPGVELGRFVRGTFNMGKDPAGNERQVASELLRAITGVAEIEVKPENIVMYASFDYSDNVIGARQIFNSAVKTRGELNPQNAIDTYIAANEALFRTQSKMYQVVQDMRALGQSDGDIRRALKDFNIPDVSKLMRGEFSPLKVSSDTRRTVRENGNSLPLVELQSIRMELMSRTLGEADSTAQSAPAPLTDSVFTVPANQVPAPSVPAAAPTSPAPAITQPVTPAAAPIQLGKATTGGASRSAELFGDSPVDAAKNMEIQRRLVG